MQGAGLASAAALVPTPQPSTSAPCCSSRTAQQQPSYFYRDKSATAECCLGAISASRTSTNDFELMKETTQVINVQGWLRTNVLPRV